MNISSVHKFPCLAIGCYAFVRTNRKDYDEVYNKIKSLCLKHKCNKTKKCLSKEEYETIENLIKPYVGIFALIKIKSLWLLSTTRRVDKTLPHSIAECEKIYPIIIDDEQPSTSTKSILKETTVSSTTLDEEENLKKVKFNIPNTNLE